MCFSPSGFLYLPLARKETAMKLWKPMLAILLGSGLIISLGLTACGDDDDEEVEGMTCGEAYEQFISTECTTQAYANVDALKTCIDTAVTEQDVDLCLDAFAAVIPNCFPAVDILFDGCGQCQEDCGSAFAGDDGVTGCLEGSQTGSECLDALIACVNAC
jgi:hypothetical protein